RLNYFGNLGTTADQRSTEMNRVGIFNFQMSGGKVTNKVRVTDVRDGTSNTAMFAEIKRSTVGGGGWPISGDTYNLTNTYLLPDNDEAWTLSTPQSGPLFDQPDGPFAGKTYRCNSWNYKPTNRITYRGLQYYRGIVEMQNYTHTVPPNYPGYDCGNASITA